MTAVPQLIHEISLSIKQIEIPRLYFFHINFVNAYASNLHNGWIKFPYIFCVCVCVKKSQYRVLSGEYSGYNSSLQLRPISSASDSATCLSVLALVALDKNFLSMYSIQKTYK